ncbi:MAG: protease modulator HflC [Dokdonella sp.]|uniref:protease modulator HflC n=1 Tax=Dokdonella sp. TaxID=2291710 RepID=UPI0025C08B03|nr:protease modulator HflC [Dokdonella sp.]MBZ0222532.1 protease modulator HflC [Dokdonella sp.]MCC7256120.1 protease modulator HflC [Dokdonella sp.]
MRTIPVVIGALALLVGANSAYVVNQSQTAILLQFGRIVRTGIEPGLHFRIPFMQQVKRFDKRLLSFDSQPERSLTAEKKDVTIDFFVKWRIVDAARYYVAVAGDEAQARDRIAPKVKEGLRRAINARTLQELVAGGRADLTKDLVAESNKATQDLGIEIVDLRIKRIDLPEDGTVINSVYERMKAERKKVASQLRAEGEEAARTIRADAQRQVQVVKAEAYRDAEKTRGEGDANASQVYAAAYGRNPEFYSFYRSLEAYRDVFAQDNGLFVLDPKSEFLHYLQDSK